MKYSFLNDYSEVAHPQILEQLLKYRGQNIGYGMDDETISAQKLLIEKMKTKADIHFIAGGTLTNLVVISSILKPYEAVISCDTGHINVHETGAIEGTGHKVIAVKSKNGKIEITEIEKVLKEHNNEHCVSPRMVFISNATELGSIYTKEELKSLADYCKKKDLYLYMDGARLANALVCSDNNLTLSDIAKYVDIFYIGGTKNGLPFGEALVIVNDKLKKEFRYHLKHRGALLAKGFIPALCFKEALKDDLFFKMAQNANNCASYLSYELQKSKVSFLVQSKTNQIFPIIKKTSFDVLKKDYRFEKWSDYDDTHYVVRLVTSWNTTLDVCEKFITDFRNVNLR